MGATAPMPTRAAVHTPLASSETLTPQPATAISICGTWQSQAEEQFARLQRVATDAGDKRLNRQFARARGSRDETLRAYSDQRGDGVAGRRRVAQVATH